METYRTHEVRVTDLSRKKELVLDTREKTASVDDISEAQAKQYRTDLMEPFNLLSVLRAKAGTTVRELPQEKLGGRAARVYDIRRPQSKEAARLWVDDATDFPARFRAGDEARPECVIDFTDWNEKLDPELFSLDVPKGYTAGVQKPPTPPESKPDAGPTQFVLFRRAMDNAEKAKSVSFEFRPQISGRKETAVKITIQGNRVREEIAGEFVGVLDVGAKKGIELQLKKKRARVLALHNDERAKLLNPVAQLLDLKEEAKFTGREELGGRKVDAYRIESGNALGVKGKWTVWIDPKTQLPVKIHLRQDLSGTVREATFDKFVWNEKLDPKLFSLDVPKGYKVEDTSKPKPKK